MIKILGSAALVLFAINVTGYAEQVAISEKQHLVSNHRDMSDYTASTQCEPSVSVETFQNTASNETSNEGLNPEGIRLLNWNVLKGSRQNWRDDFQRLALLSDIIAIQEAQLHQEFHAGLKVSKLHWDLNTAFYVDRAETGVLTGSNVKPSRTCTLRADEPLIMFPKTALVNEYQIQGMDQTLLVANIHMINFSFSTGEYQEQISQLVDAVDHHVGPLVLTGDFNTWSQERMDIINEMTTKLGLSAVEYDNDHRMTVFGSPVDHVYIRGLETLHADTESVDSSDHNPMMTTFRLARL